MSRVLESLNNWYAVPPEEFGNVVRKIRWDKVEPVWARLLIAADELGLSSIPRWCKRWFSFWVPPDVCVSPDMERVCF